MTGILSALVASFIYAAVNTILVALFSISSDNSYFAILMQQVSAHREGVVQTDKPGLVVVQIDGLAQPILMRQIRAGRVPHLSNWVRSGRYRLWGGRRSCPRPRRRARRESSTGTTTASRPSAGIRRVPAGSWSPTIRRTRWRSRPGSRMVRGFCSNDGASVGNLFSGDAVHSYITMATIKDKGQGLGQSQTFLTFFASPYNYLRHHRPLRRRDDQGEHPGASPGFERHRPPDAPRATLSHRARRHQRRPARPVDVARHRGDVPGSAGHLRRLHGLRRDRPPQRARAGRDIRRPRRRGPGDRDPGEGRQVRGPTPTSSSSCRTTARPWGRRSSSATARPWGT